MQTLSEKLERSQKVKNKNQMNPTRYERLKPQSDDDSDLTNFNINTPLSGKEKELARLVNQYRVSQGMKPLPVSKSLTYVARTHNKDQIQHFRLDLTDSRGIEANAHSWSNHGNWTPVRYTDDHRYMSGMHNKPKELTNFKVKGYEIEMDIQDGRDNSMNYAISRNVTPSHALEAWQTSPGHNAVMVGEGQWSNLSVMGVSIHNNFADIWFARETNDPAGFHSIN